MVYVVHVFGDDIILINKTRDGVIPSQNQEMPQRSHVHSLGSVILKDGEIQQVVAHMIRAGG